ncbi:Kinesin-like protein KIF20A [Chelonia mydas]|uniref:Kinesin-like protein KIF20A n=1 Tax=Chelonia mydas TaxID=8469 RepID=M7BU77_CHEMY|nr:Kinesin-like protein KIF20A [Chelonia mydas]
MLSPDKRMDYEEGSYVSSAGSGVLDFTCYEDLMGKTSPMELSVIPNADEQQQEDCVIIENPETVTLQAPKESFTMKNSEKGIGQSVHQFTFTKVFGPETTQSDFFEGTMKEIIKAYIDGANGLVFTYGVTNAGKTYTIQGSPKDGGILPRSLDMIFHHIRGRQYLKMNLKPYLSNDVKKLDVTQVKQEGTIKAAVLASLKEDIEDTSKSIIQSASLCTLESVSSSSCTSTSLPSDPLVEDSVLLDTGGTKHQRTQSSVWVSFCEIYNEYVYDLMDVLAISKNQKRKVLRICEDQGGNSYIKDLKWINVQSTEEACKILKIGNKNRSLACTRMNQHSSRRVDLEKLLVSYVCDISTHCFLHGNCTIFSLSVKHSYIPFRESKLTRLFQPFFCGKGKACMIVNINQCASTHSETLHLMKFSATAKQVIQTIHPQTFGYFAPKLVGKDGKPIVHFDANISAEEFPDEDIDTSSEEEVDITIMTHEELLKTTENLKETLVAERQSKLLLEVQIRKEMAEAMFQQLLETEETWSKRLEDVRESYEEKLENTFEMYKEAIKKHAYLCAMEQVEDHYVPIEEFVAEQEKVEDRDRKILELRQKFVERSDGLLALGIPNSDMLTAEDKVKSDLKYKELQSTTDVLQRQCNEKDEEQEMRGLQNWAKRVLELEATVSLLQEELDERKKHLYSEELKEQKPKRGLFANLKSTVAVTSKTPVGKTLGKSEDSPTMSRKQAIFARKVKE